MAPWGAPAAAGEIYAAILCGAPAVSHDYDHFDYAARMEHFELGLRRVLDRADWPKIGWMRACARQGAPGEWFLAVVRGAAVFAGCGSL